MLESFVPPTGGIPPVEVPHVVRPTGRNLYPECPGGVPGGGTRGGVPGGVPGGYPGICFGFMHLIDRVLKNPGTYRYYYYRYLGTLKFSNTPYPTRNTLPGSTYAFLLESTGV